MDDTNESKIEYIMDLSNLPQFHCQDMSYTIDTLSKLVTTYNLLINSVDGFNRNSFAKRNDVEAAIDRAKDLGKIIDNMIDVLKAEVSIYIDYIKTKEDYLNINFTLNDIIKHELDHHVIKKIEHKEKEEED